MVFKPISIVCNYYGKPNLKNIGEFKDTHSEKVP